MQLRRRMIVEAYCPRLLQRLFRLSESLTSQVRLTVIHRLAITWLSLGYHLAIAWLSLGYHLTIIGRAGGRVP